MDNNKLESKINSVLHARTHTHVHGVQMNDRRHRACWGSIEERALHELTVKFALSERCARARAQMLIDDMNELIALWVFQFADSSLKIGISRYNQEQMGRENQL